MSIHFTHRISGTCALLYMSLAVSVAHGATNYTFTANGGSSGDWSQATNWSPDTGYPVSGDTAIIPNGKTCLVEQSNQTCATVTINSGGILQVKGRDLTIESDMTINGTLQLKAVDEVYGQIKFDTPITLGGSGLIDARAANGLGLGSFRSDSEYYLTIGGGLIVRGSVDFHCYLDLDGDVIVDGEDMASVQPLVQDHANVKGAGRFIADGDGVITFWSANFRPQEGFSRLWVKSGTIRFGETCSFCHDVDWLLVIDGGGVLVADSNVLFDGFCQLSSGKIRVAAEMTVVLDPPE